MSQLLNAKNVSKRYATRSGDLVVLRDVSLALDAGDSIAIMGPSGSGKSTLLNILGTLDTPSDGTIMIHGADPFSLSDRELARFRNQRIGFVFQEHHLMPQCSVLENVLLPTLVEASSEGGLDRARELLKRVGLSDRLDHRPAELSGGERQRVAIARALINEPALLLADEPTGNLDAKTAAGVGDLLLEMHGDQRCGLVVVTHSEPFAERFGRRVSIVDGAFQS